MATVRNYIDVILQASGTRINTIILPTNIRVDTPNVATGLQNNINAQRNLVYRQSTAPTGPLIVDGTFWQHTGMVPERLYMLEGTIWRPVGTVNDGIFSTLAGQVTSSNYATYLGDNSISNLAFSQNATNNTSSISTSLSFNSDGRNVSALIAARVSTRYSATTGYTQLNLLLTVGGTTVYDAFVAQINHSTTPDFQQASIVQPILIASPGSGSVSYALTASITTTGDGSGSALVGRPTIQLFGLKR
jgi:hypothetical protein